MYVYISVGVIPRISDRLRHCKWLLIAFINKKNCVLFRQANIGFLLCEGSQAKAIDRNIKCLLVTFLTPTN